MWLVRIALRRPYTVHCGVLVLLGIGSIFTMPTALFPRSIFRWWP